jgi:hypothetical protein
VRGRRGANHGGGPLAHAIELAGGGETRGRVHQHDRRLVRQCRGGAGDVRPRKRERQQQQRCCAQRQEQELAESAAPRLLDGRLAQVAHRRKLDDRFGAPVKQMNRDWHRDGRSAGQKER